jgi:hypothetical protein
MNFRQRLAAWFGAAIVLLAPVLAFIARDDIVDRNPMDPGEAAADIAALHARVDHPLDAISVTLEPDKMVVELQNPSKPTVTDAWTISHIQGLRGMLDWIYLSGPDPVQTNQGGLPIAERVFDVSTVDFDVVPQIIKAATDRAALEEAATVTGMELGRGRFFFPVEHAGDVRWSVTVKSAHESADAYADPAGHLTGIDLRGTLRAQLLDLYKGGKPLVDIAHAVTAQFGGHEQIDHLLVYTDNISFHVASAGPGSEPGTYTSDINGIRHNAIMDSAPMPKLPMMDWGPRDSPVSMAEIDWNAMPHIVQAARDALNMPDAKIQLLEIRKRAHALGPARIEWEFDLQPRVGAPGSVTLDNSGAVLESRPPGGTKAPDFLEPAQTRRFFEALRREVAPHSAMMQITLTPKSAVADLRDPRKADAIASLGYDGSKFDFRPSVPEPPGRWDGMPYDDTALFNLDMVDAKLLDTIPARESDALRRLNIPGGKVGGIVIGRQTIMFENNRQLLIEIQVEGDDRRDGRVYFDPAGRVLRADGP